VDLIKSFCSRCILIDGGVVVFDGAPNEVAQRYEDLFTLK
jgi:ABC-type polysaccharide/polyol phosphate transport system ATPase subunit